MKNKVLGKRYWVTYDVPLMALHVEILVKNEDYYLRHRTPAAIELLSARSYMGDLEVYETEIEDMEEDVLPSKAHVISEGEYLKLLAWMQKGG